MNTQSFSRPFPALALMLGLLTFGLAGCNQQPAADAPTADSAVEEGHDHDHAHAEGEEDSAVVVALAKLSDEDRALAESQKICPVGEGALGSMGTPVKVDVNGKPVFICCEHCREPLLEDPDKYLANLVDAADGDAATDEGASEETAGSEESGT
ncbi:hypothetical protein Mal4_33640 [Maioricimonas rarisocia]|uniref:TRASH domain-containing protein n=1 Tax=Maioricimonas rarisocia TaxID=2528026 RepID=A0A517Z9B4_9PLAN|nr:hypothetical protein [Maioricimonas rarisocia]QDU39031.1 hypothetical protein Mal4_33640 [Maioricimonas rarisocia]